VGEPLPDAIAGSLWVRAAPAFLLPYVQLARLDRPIGWWLLLLPCWWSSAIASIAQSRPPELVHLGLFMLGAIAMRGAGSTYNDIVDRDLDARVERTRLRPLARGSLSVGAALVFLALQSAIGLMVLLCFNRFAILLGFGSLGFVAIYPFLKRVTSWPQAGLGLAFAWGGLMGWATQFASLSFPAFAVYAAAIAWTIGYDTIYALQDTRDDAIVGIRSTARLFGPNVRRGVALVYAATCVCLAAGLTAVGAGPFAWLGLALFALHLGWQVTAIVPGDPARALRLFRSNRDAGLLLFAGFAAQAFFAAYS
jgi:4-hydroxybenzoate polyprenyltransferase